MTYREADQRRARGRAGARSDACYLLGEDVANDGGVFKTNDGLPEAFGRARDEHADLREQASSASRIGMAVTGLRPVVEIMFSDFLPTAGDAIVEELPKFRFMSGGQCALPVTVRSIGGGDRPLRHAALGDRRVVVHRRSPA